MTYPYYRVTKRELTIESLGSWWDWFVGLGVPCAIVSDKEIHPYKPYSLWVVGDETVGEDGEDKEKRANTERIDGEILKAHGYWRCQDLTTLYNCSSGIPGDYSSKNYIVQRGVQYENKSKRDV